MKTLLNFLIVFSVLLHFGRNQSNVNEKTIATIKKYIDDRQDPCEDYFSYACGNWDKYHRNGRYSESTGFVDHKVNKHLVQFLENYNQSGDSFIDKVWTYYMSCRYQRTKSDLRYLQIARPSEGLNWPLIDHIENVTIEWPGGQFNWMLTIANLRKYGLNNVLIEHLVLRSGYGVKGYIIDLDSPSFEGLNQLPGVFRILRHLEESGVKIAIALEITREIKQFENKVSGLITNYRNDVTPLILKDIESYLPSLPWRKYMETILGHPVAADYTFQMRNLEYFEKLSTLIQETDPRVVCNYIAYRFLMYLHLDASSTPDKIDCVVDVRSKMDLALNFIYREHFYKQNEETKNHEVLEIINDIRNEFRNKLSENINGLTRHEQKYLEEKLNKMQVLMGNLPKNITQDFVSNHYESVELHPRNYFKNQLALLHLRFQNEHQLLVEGLPHRDNFFYITDSDTARSSTPFYLMRRNMIVVPYGFLQTPIYYPTMLKVLKYSLLGFNLAHEIAHGFDGSSIKYDFEGAENQTGKNITQNEQIFNSLNCMSRKRTVSLDERTADIVGIRLAYDAFFNRNNDSNNFEETYSGRTVRELFFLNFAQFFCGNLNAQFVDHDADDIRMQETLMNFEAFAETYQCRPGSPLNSEKICRLW